jgi:hypothetical protein
MIRIIIILIFALYFLPAHGDDDETAETIVPASLAELAERADLVAVVQVRDTDYFMRRDIPVSGSAYLRILIPYKLDRPLDVIDVFEKGLHEHECYFDNPSVFEEGRRYLVFLQRDPEDEERFLGMDQGCALEILVDENNRYAIRYPADGILLSDELSPLARPIRFADSYAVVDEEDISPEWRNEMAEAGYLVEFIPPEVSDTGQRANWMPEPEDPHRYWLYTHGIDLGTLRQMLGAENLTWDRHQRRAPD